uniref:Uncharacterized protein n=1 Tax=Oryza sativa subsp. japonica TaxID=39947 RepID=Q339K0_ORYSJ|nr:hypothetical protein LOC_Os10g20759 [Oryza sativa Japonica Group]
MRPAAAMCLVAAPCSAVDLAAASPSTPPPNRSDLSET